MRAEEKLKFVQEVRGLQKSLNEKVLLNNPDDDGQIKLINRAIAIFKYFSQDVGEELERRRDEFQKWTRAGNRPEHSKNLLKNMLQFLHQKTEEMDIYHIEPGLTSDQSEIRKLQLQFRGLQLIITFLVATFITIIYAIAKIQQIEFYPKPLLKFGLLSILPITFLSINFLFFYIIYP